MEKPSQPFQTFCTSLLDKVASVKGVNRKKDVLSDFLHDWRRQYGLDFYDPLRLIMPEYCGRKYNLKEAGLAIVINKALVLSSNAPDAIYLKNYKRPNGNRPSGIFHAAVYDVISKRSQVTSSNKTVHDLNVLLDELSSKRDLDDDDDLESQSTGEKHVKVFKKMIDQYTPHQIQWIIRIILKDLNIHLSELSILTVLHPNAKELYEAGRSLKELCKSVADPKGFESSFNGVRLFSPCIPQSGKKFQSSKGDGDFQKLHKPFYVEQKLDGERMLMHYDPDTDKFMWFTRKQNDNSRRYGDTSKNTAKLSSRIFRGLPNRSCILDGEMVAYDPTFKGFLPFGTLKSTSVDDKGNERADVNVNVDINDPSKPHPCYVVFDILYYDGKSIINNPLEERLQLLNMVVKNQNQHMMLMTRQKMSTMEEIQLALEEAIKKQQEGLVVKDPTSKYMLHSRTGAWLKFKPEFMDSFGENCDVLVVGAKYGSGTYGGVLRQILCAVLDDSNPDKNDPRFLTFAMVHSGLKDADVTYLNSRAENCKQSVPGQNPSWVYHPPKSNEKPDTWIPFDDVNPLIAEIKGSEVIPSAQFALQHTLRFPRLVKFRHDKDWKDIMTVTDFTRMQTEKRRGQKRAAQEDAENEKRKQRKSTYSLIASQQGADISKLKVEGSLFEEMKFYVMNGTKDLNKNDIEELIYKNGGTFIQSLLDNAIAIGSDDDKNQPYRLQVLHDNKKCDIRRAQWIVDCVAANDLLPLEPRYMYVTSDATRAEMLTRMDEYGDHYTKHVKEDQLKEILEGIKKDESETDQERRHICQQVMEKYFKDQHMPGFLFLNVSAYFDEDTSMDIDEPPSPKTVPWVRWKKLRDQMNISKEKFKFEMGDVRTTTADEEVTHVVINQNDMSRFSLLKNQFHRPRLPRFVTTEWIQACIENRTLVDELEYQPKVPNEL